MALAIQAMVDDRLRDSSGSTPAPPVTSVTAISKSIARRKAGQRFYTSDEFMEGMKAAIAEGKNDPI